MLTDLPAYISIGFIFTTFLTLMLIVWIIRSSSKPAVRKNAVFISFLLLVWMIMQGALTIKGLYLSDPHAIPPKIMTFGVLPALLIILLLFISKSGRNFIDSLSIRSLTYLHIVRIPVEFILYGLFIYKTVPELMTFAGRNFDILAGISAAFVAYFGISKKRMGSNALLIWNFLCLGLLLNIVVNAVLSAPFPFQQFAFKQPNIAILNFPFSWLPTFIVPVVLFCHLAAIRQLWLLKNNG